MIDEMIQQGWSLMTKVLFSNESNMIYDSVSTHDPEHRFDHLPQTDEIAADLPNPAGWGTGMEDCMLNAGSAMEIAILIAERQPALREEACRFARHVLAGMRDAAESHGVIGYVARGVSNRLPHICYSNSSRDQFTLFVYGVSRWMHSGFALQEDRELARRLLCEVADYCLSRLKSEQHCNLLRLDGGLGLVCDMIDVAPHEAMRLPMIYLAAYDASGEPRYLEAYRRARVYGLEHSTRIKREYNWWNLELEQMQISLRFCYDFDPDEEARQTLLNLMDQVAEYSYERFPEQESWILGYSGSFSCVSRRWNDMELILHSATRQPGRSALFCGKIYMKPQIHPEFQNPFCMVRAIGNLTLAMALDPEWRVPKGFPERFQRCMAKCDWTTHTSGGVVNFLHGALMLLKAMER